MRSLYILRGPLRREIRSQPWKILKRYKFHGQPDRSDAAKSTLLPTTPARTRFAPSPTGYLHLGSLRTALYNYLLAKATNGQFLLRIEDTDQTRIVSDAERRLYEDLKWSGLPWDEGPDLGGDFGPYRQSERLHIYNEHVASLIKNGHAYRCFCSPEDLDRLKAQSIQDGTPLRYNGTCSHVSEDASSRRAASGEPHCVRLRSKPAPLVQDLVYGAYKSPFEEDDFILMKRDGYPTYHFANVIDDHLMQITHVVRGAEWLVSTPRHVLLYEAFGWEAPKFAHVGLLVDQNRQKLSKRHGDIDIASFRNRGFLPPALLNYISLLGWSPGKGQKGSSDIMQLQDMINKFHLRFTKGDIRVNNKLEYMQSKHMKAILSNPTAPEARKTIDKAINPAVEEIIVKLEHSDEKTNHEIGALTTPARGPEGESLVSHEYLRKLLVINALEYKDPESHVERNKYLLWEVPSQVYSRSLSDLVDKVGLPVVIQQENGELEYVGPRPTRIVARFEESLRGINEDEWTQEVLQDKLRPVSGSFWREETKLSGWHFLRWVLCAGYHGPALIPSIEALGKTETMSRIESALKIASDWEAENKEGGT